MRATVRRWVLGCAGPGLCLIGCARGNELLLEQEGTALTYNCEGPEVTATTETERDLIRRKAVVMTQHANDRRDVAQVTTMVEAYESADFAQLEMLVVGRLCEHPVEGAREPRFPEKGSVAPAFELNTVVLPNGESGPEVIRVPDARGRYVLLDFWATWCPPCRDKYPEMVRIAEDFRARGLEVVGVAYEDSPERVTRWVEEREGVQYPWIAAERASALAREYQIWGIPRTFLIDPAGRVVTNQFGTWDPESVRALLDDLL
jgi:thiol-disulfide isomerase/thioredoxin